MSDAGDANLVLDDETFTLVVSGLASGGQRATATVDTSVAGGMPGSAQVSGRSTLTQLIPTFAPPVRDVGGFTAEITNYDDGYGWSADSDEGAARVVEVVDGENTTHVVEVTGLTDGQSSTVTVTATAPGDVVGSADVMSAALGAALVPAFGTPVAEDGAFSVEITNYDGSYLFDPVATEGTPTIDTDGPTAQVVVTGLDVGESSTVIVGTSQDGFQSASSQVAGTSLAAALEPQFGLLTRTDGGFTAPLTNFAENQDYSWAASATEGDADVVDGQLVVTGLEDGQESTATVTTTKAGHFEGTNDITEAALDPALTPELGAAVPGDGEFTVEISNYSTDYNWPLQTTAGSAAIDGSGSPTVVRVSGLGVGESATVTVGTTRDGYLSGSAEQPGASLAAALNPTFGPVVRTAEGFTVPITNFDGLFDFEPTATVGTAILEVTGPDAEIVVTGLAIGGQRSTVTVATTRVGYSDGTGEVSGRSILGELTPEFSTPVRTVGGFTADITNYDNGYTWGATTNAGAVQIVPVVDGEDTRQVVTVTGLADGESATVTVTTEAPGNVDGSAPLTSAALEAALTPEFGTLSPGDGGFTVEISNYDSDYNWPFTLTVGNGSIDTDGATPLFVVTGLGVGEQSTLTLETTREGYRPGEASIEGISTQQALEPVFGPAERTEGGFIVPITNFDASYDWSTSGGPGSSVVNPVGEAGELVVTGLQNGESATITVTTNKAGFFEGTNTATEAALATGLTPTFGTPVPGASSFTVEITNYDADYTWTPTSTLGAAVLDTSGPVVVRVTGLDPVTESTVTVDVTRTGYLPASDSVTGISAVGGQLTPSFGAAVPTADGFTAEVLNFDEAFTWNATSTLGEARVNQQGVLIVTGVDPNTAVSATVTTTRPNYDEGSAGTSSTSLKAAYIAQVRNASQLNGAFSVEISNFTSRYSWSATSTKGSASVSDQGLVRVTGLQPGETADLQILSDRPGYAQGVKAVSAEALGAALVPSFGPVTATASGFTVAITNFDGSYTWNAVAAPGQASVNGSGIVTVSDLSAGAGSTVTITSSLSDHESGTASVDGQASVNIPPALPPAKPTVTKVVAKKKGKVKVKWVPQDISRSPVTSAAAVCKAKGSKRTGSGSGYTVTVKGLTRGKTYKCSVKVSNVFGTSPTSNKVKVKAK